MKALRGEEPVAATCRKHGIAESLHSIETLGIKNHSIGHEKPSTDGVLKSTALDKARSHKAAYSMGF